MRLAAPALLVLLAAPAAAQESGWHYSPYPGEGDRAALGCAYGATPANHVCLAVRCEDDFSVGLYIHTSRLAGDVGAWVLEFDREMTRFAVTTVASDTPYGSRIEGDVTDILFNIENAGLVYLDPQAGAPMARAISLAGSLHAINRALFYCPSTERGPEARDLVIDPELVAPVPAPQLTR